MANLDDRDEREKSADTVQESNSHSQGFGNQEKKSTAGSVDTRNREIDPNEELGSSDRKAPRQMMGGPDKPTA